MRWLAATLAAAFSFSALAQHNHDHGHPDYKNWRSERAPHSCCNDEDCSGIEDTEVRQTATGTQVRIEGQWCPVFPQHFLTRGKSPDWSVNHICVRSSKYMSGGPCERLLCFMPKGGV